MNIGINRKVQLWMVIAGFAVVIGFFLPLFEVGGRTWLSGWQILREGDLPMRYWLLALAHPVGGLALIVTALAGVGAARWVSLGLGGVAVVFPIYKLVSLLVEVAGSGAFLMFGGGLAALICGIAGMGRPAIVKPKKP